MIPGPHRSGAGVLWGTNGPCPTEGPTISGVQETICVVVFSCWVSFFRGESLPKVKEVGIKRLKDTPFQQEAFFQRRIEVAGAQKYTETTTPENLGRVQRVSSEFPEKTASQKAFLSQ